MLPLAPIGLTMVIVYSFSRRGLLSTLPSWRALQNPLLSLFHGGISWRAAQVKLVQAFIQEQNHGPAIDYFKSYAQTQTTQTVEKTWISIDHVVVLAYYKPVNELAYSTKITGLGKVLEAHVAHVLGFASCYVTFSNFPSEWPIIISLEYSHWCIN